MADAYIGITIGPIYETIRLSSKPSAMWLSSYMFSYMAKRLCDNIQTRIPSSKNSIVSPYLGGDLSRMNKGIGLMHDRVIFKTDNPKDDLKTLEDICKQVKDEIASLFGGDTNWFNKYLQIHAVAFESKSNPIIDSLVYLDSIEYAKLFPNKSEKNPILEILDADDVNYKIRQIRNALKLKSWPFNIADESETQPEMVYIVGKEAERRRNKSAPKKAFAYYAVVQSDGDSFGKYISNTPEASEKCLEFSSEASDIIQEYGGVTIYAGGDDLLFIAPLWEKPNEDIQSRRNLFCLINLIRDKFKEKFKGGNAPTISFGIAVRYYKYPLYEAFDEACDLLFRKAKNKRDSLAFSLRKHSGQSSEFMLYNLSGCEIPNALVEMTGPRRDGEFLNSVSIKIAQFKTLFETALKKKNTAILNNLFENIFDSDIHKQHKLELDGTLRLLNLINDNIPEDKSIDERTYNDKLDDTNVALMLDRLDAMLRLVKFYSETGFEEEDDDAAEN